MTLVLTHDQHHDVATPLRASHAIDVREGAAQCRPVVDEVPPLLRSRTLSLRGFDCDGIMVTADLAESVMLEPRARRCCPIRRCGGSPPLREVRL
jgi:hypothetical protein